MTFGVPISRHEPRRSFSKEELIEYLQDRECRSTRDLCRHRQSGEPMVWDYRKAFGSWSMAQLAAFGDEEKAEQRRKNADDAEYLVRTVLELNLWTRGKWRKAREKMPDVIPSEFHVVRHWGSFEGLFAFARIYSMRHVVYDYMGLKLRLRKTPTWDDCDVAGLDIRESVRLMGGKREFDRFVKDLERIGHAQRARSG